MDFGREILKIVPGRVSTEVDAAPELRHRGGRIAKARKLIGCTRSTASTASAILIKIASTWEGIKAAEQLEKEGIHCNLTLLFSFAQAVACAEARVTLISPFVGRIYDWYKKERGVADIPADEDPGRRVGDADLQLLQEVRLQDPGHGRELPQGRADHRPGRLRPADDQPRPAGEAGRDRRRADPPADARVGQGQRRRRRSTSTRRPSAGCTTRTRWPSRS